MKNDNGNDCFKFWQLLEQAEELTKKSLAPATALEILDAIDLPQKSEYSMLEGQKFLEAYQLLISASVNIEQLKTIFSAKQTVQTIEADAKKKAHHLTTQMGTAMALKEKELGTLWLLLLEERLNQWSESGFLDLVAAEARTRVLKARESGISLETDYLDWCANREPITQKIKARLELKKSKNYQGNTTQK